MLFLVTPHVLRQLIPFVVAVLPPYSYPQSFVQSRKKQGVVVGYAARRAGLIADDELEKIACSKHRIIVPSSQGSEAKQPIKKRKV